jgi:carbamoylphosphate synthase large subunit
MAKKVYSEPSKVEAQTDGIHVEGPDAVEVTLTPKAALETAKRLGNAAVDMLVGNPESPPKDDAKT